MFTAYDARPLKTAAQRYLDGWNDSDSRPEVRETGWDVVYGVQKPKGSAPAVRWLKGVWLVGLGLSALGLGGWTTLHRIEKRTPRSSVEETFKYSVVGRITH